MLKLFAAFADECDSIDVTADPASNFGKLGEGLIPIELGRRQLRRQKLGGESVGLHPAPPSLALKALVEIRRQMNDAISRCHGIQSRTRFKSRPQHENHRWEPPRS